SSCRVRVRSFWATCRSSRPTSIASTVSSSKWASCTGPCPPRLRVDHQGYADSATMAHVPAERCLSIIQLLADDAGEMPLGEIADRLKLPKSGSHRLLATLVKLGWAEQNPQTGFYR